MPPLAVIITFKCKTPRKLFDDLVIANRLGKSLTGEEYEQQADKELVVEDNLMIQIEYNKQKREVTLKYLIEYYNEGYIKRVLEKYEAEGDVTIKYRRW